MAKYIYSDDRKECLAQIEAIVASAKNMHDNIRKVMLNCLLHAVKFEDVTLATELCAKIKDVRTINHGNISTWFEQAGPFTWDNKDKQYKLNRDKREQLKKELDAIGLPKFIKLIEAIDLKKNPEYKGFSTIVKLRAIVNEAKKVAGDEAKANSDKTDLTGMGDIEALLLKLTQDAGNDDIEVVGGEIA